MMSVEVIRDMQRKATERAAKQNSVPFIVEREDLEDWAKGNWHFPFPFLGDFVPNGWKMTGKYFVDSTGFGTTQDPALSVRQFLGKLKPGYGYAIVEAGQFQVYVGEYEKVKKVYDSADEEPIGFRSQKELLKENEKFIDQYGRRKL